MSRSRRVRPALPPVLALAAALAVAVACGREVSTEGDAPVLSRSRDIAGMGPAGPEGSAGDPASTGAGGSLATVLYSERDAELRSRIAGVVREVRAELGDRVEPGQVLAVLEDGEERAQLAAAEAEHELARSRQARAVPLAEQEMVTAAQLEEHAYEVRRAAAALELARARLEHTRIRAPFAGVVSHRFIRVGETVAEGDPLFRATSLEPLRARVRVPEAAARGLAPGQSLRLVGVAGQEAQGRVFRVAPAVDGTSGTVEVLVDVPRPGGLRPGSAVVVEWPAAPATDG